MLTKEQIVELINKNEHTDIEIIELIRSYIYEKKGIDVGNIEKPNTMRQLSLLNVASNTIFPYFYNKYVKNEQE